MFENSAISIEHADILKGPHQIAFDITNKCNLRCLHCYNASGENIVFNNELTDEEILDFMRDLAELKLYNICFCGGEPLMKKDLIIECSKLLKSCGISQISMVTNGLLMTEETARQLIDSGVNRIQISIDGCEPATHDRLRNKAGAFEKAMEAIKILNKMDVEVNVAFTPTSFNIHQFKDVYNMLRDLGMYDSDLRVQPLMLLGRANKNLESIKPTNIQYRQLVKEINRIKKTGEGPQVSWGDPIDHLIRFRTVSSDCINFCVVRANGDIVASPYLPLVVGNVKKHKFSEYWDAGLVRLWQYSIPKEMAKRVVSVEDMNKVYDDLPVVWEENDVYIDLIDDDLNNTGKVFGK